VRKDQLANQMRGPQRRRRAPALAIGAAMAISLAVAACSSSSSATNSAAATSAAGTSSAGSSASSCMASATAITSQYEKPMHATLPTASVNAASAKGKSVWLIAPIETAYVDAVQDSFTAAAKAAGLVPVIFNGKGSVATWNQGINEAVSQHAGAILLLSEDPALVSGALNSAFAAKIPVVDSDNVNPTDPLNGLFAHVAGDYSTVGMVQAADMLVATKCDLNAFYAGYTVYKNLTEQKDGMTAEVSKLCPSCKLDFYTVNPTTEAATLEPATLTALQRNPGINLLAGVTDVQSGEMMPALGVAGKNIPLVGQSTQGPWVQWIESGKLQADIAEGDEQYLGWAEVDEMLRAMTGAKPAFEDVPIQLYVKGSFNESSPFASLGDYQSQFEKLWGAS
jgi:ribose transport system substrate-binding protein